MRWFGRIKRYEEALRELRLLILEQSRKIDQLEYDNQTLNGDMAVFRALFWDRPFAIINPIHHEEKREYAEKGYAMRGIAGKCEVWVKK